MKKHSRLTLLRSVLSLGFVAATGVVAAQKAENPIVPAGAAL